MKTSFLLTAIFLVLISSNPAFAQSVGFDIHIGGIPLFAPPAIVPSPQVVYYEGPYRPWPVHERRWWPGYYRHEREEYWEHHRHTWQHHREREDRGHHDDYEVAPYFGERYGHRVMR